MATFTKSDLEELNRLRAENAALKKQKALTVRLGNKGNVSVYGLQAFPTTLYRNQWLRLLDNAQDIRDFIEENSDKLVDK